MDFEILRRTIYFFEFVALLVAFWAYPTYKKSPAVLLTVLLIVTLDIESVGYFNAYHPSTQFIRIMKKIFGNHIIDYNLGIYNVGIFITYLLYQAYFYKVINSVARKKTILVLSLVFVLVATIDFLLNYQYISFKYLTYLRSFGALVIGIASLLYFYETFLNDKITKMLSRLSFWAVSGSFVFYLMTVPIFVLGDRLRFSDNVYIVILTLANYILYGSFITGFIVHAKQERGKTPF